MWIVCARVCVCECVCSKLTFPVEPPSVHRMVDVSWPGTVFVAPGKIYVAVALYLCVCACVLARECVSVCVCVCVCVLYLCPVNPPGFVWIGRFSLGQGLHRHVVVDTTSTHHSALRCLWCVRRGVSLCVCARARTYRPYTLFF